MKHNVGGLDRNARIVVGVVLVIIALAAAITLPWRIALLVVAAIALATAAARYCPANALLGIDSSKAEDEHHTHGGAAS